MMKEKIDSIYWLTYLNAHSLHLLAGVHNHTDLANLLTTNSLFI